MLVKFQFDAYCFNGIGSKKSPPKAALGVSVPSTEGLLVSPLDDARKKKYISDKFIGPREPKVTVLKEDPRGKRYKPDRVSPGPYRRSVARKLEGSSVNGSVERVQTKCSTKWASYGGCIPSILQALETVRDLDKALEPWEDTINNKERSIILKEQVSWERAVEIFEWFKRKGFYELNVIHYNIMFRILGRARKWDHVERLWKEMKVRGVVPINSTFGTLIDVYSKGGLREEAVFWLEKMRESRMEPDVVTMGIVMQMYKKFGEVHKVEEYFKKWSMSESPTCRGCQKVGRKHWRWVPRKVSNHTYNTLIDMYGKAGRLKEASETVKTMLRDGIVPTTVTFNTIIHMYGNHGKLDEVTVLMQTMEQLKCPPDTRTYNILISLHAKHGDISTAQRYFVTMKEAGVEPNLVSYRTLLFALSIRHMVGPAEALVLEMDEKGIEIDEHTQSALTRMYIEAKMREKSWLWFRRFHLSGTMSSSCYSANIDAYGEGGLVLEAEKVFMCCKEAKKLTVVEFNVMIKAYGLAKQYDKARQLFDGMGGHGIVPDKICYSSIIQILAGGDWPDEATLYLREMQRAELVFDCLPYCAVISSFIKLGKLDKAEELYKQMIRFDVKPDMVLYGTMINAFADAGSVKQALGYVDAMKKAGQPGNTVINNSLIKLYTKVGYLKEAQDIYKLLQSSEAGPEVYASNCMIDLYSERSMVAHAEEIFASLKRKGAANEFSFAMMLCMYKRVGRFDDAILIAKQMRESKLLTDILSYNNVLRLYASNGRLREAVRTFQELLAGEILPDDFTFKSLGIVLLKCGISKQAITKLEWKRKCDPRGGLQEWQSILLSLFDVDYDVVDKDV